MVFTGGLPILPFPCIPTTSGAFSLYCCPWNKEDDGTIGNCYAFGYYSCMADTRSPETACNDGEDNDCDNAIDCLDSDCAGAINCPATCAANKLCVVGCVRRLVPK